MRVTIRIVTTPGGAGRGPLHQAAVFPTTEQDVAPLMTSPWGDREPEVFRAAQDWARRNAYVVANPRSGTFYGSACRY